MTTTMAPDLPRPRKARAGWLAVPAVALAAVAGLGSPARAGEAGKGWQLGEVRDIPAVVTQAMRSTGVGIGPGVKLEQVGVIRPNVRPGDRAAAEAQYAVNAPAGSMQVRETRIVQFNGTTLTSRERVFSRQTGRVRSESPLVIPPDAAEGIYTVTTIIAPVVATRGPAREEKAETVFVVKSAGPPAAPPAAGAPSSTGGLEIRVWTDKNRYRFGEKVTISFETNRDAHVTILNKGTSGKVNVLFPNAYTAGSAVKGNTRYTVPGPADTFEMVVAGPPGQDMIIATATVPPMPPQGPAPSPVSAGPPSPPGPTAPAAGPAQPPLNVSIMTRDINVHSANVPR